MTLGEKVRYLRTMEGTLRGLGREMTQQELSKAVKEELGESLSQSYLSQIENGTRPHLTNKTRMLLAKFFKVQPGYLVTDPEGFSTELVSELRVQEDTLDLWLVSGAEKFRRDPEIRQALLGVANHQDTRRALLVMASVLDSPGLLDRLAKVLRPELVEAAEPNGASRKKKAKKSGESL